jgi:histidyl-tRNA synthetase
MKKEEKLTPGLPSGFEDRWNKQLSLKKKLLEIIENNFLKFGFSPLETPSFEISKNIGSFLANDEDNPMSDVFTFNDGNEKITLRYDLSSPLSRFVAQNYRELPFPYKRYAIGNVWRNEKPDTGKSRYREFSQADCDIIGNVNSSQADAEICNIIADTLTKCGLGDKQFKVSISNRKIVQGLINQLKIFDKYQELKVIRAIDKLDRIGIKGVEDLLKKERIDASGAVTKGANLSDAQASEILNFLKIKNIKDLKSTLKNSLSVEGIKETEGLLEIISYGKYSKLIQTNFTIVRGLAYYDGFCVETNLNFKVKNPKGKEIDVGSVASGGRYDKLISRFKGTDFPGTGMSIGVDRLLFVLSQIDTINTKNNKPVLICILDNKYLKKYYETLNYLRENGINSELYLDPSKNLKKQLTYADKRNLPLAIICGETEFKENKVTLKNLRSSKGKENQITISKDNLINEINKLI